MYLKAHISLHMTQILNFQYVFIKFIVPNQMQNYTFIYYQRCSILFDFMVNWLNQRLYYSIEKMKIMIYFLLCRLINL